MKDRRDLIEKLQLIEEERKNQYKEYKDLANQKADLDRRLNMKVGELESLKNSSNPTGIVNDITSNNNAVKRLMEQNEKLIQEINVLKTGKAKPIDIDQLQNPDAKKLYEVN
jgi:hypothetical protein